MMILLFDPEHHRSDVHERPLQAAEEYEWQRALRDAEALRRAERKAIRKPRSRLHLPPFMRRVPAVKS